MVTGVHLGLILLSLDLSWAVNNCDPLTTWKEANSCCRSRGHRLPPVETEVDFRFVTQIAKDMDLRSVWVSLKKKKMASWTWVDGTTIRNDTAVDEDAGGDCAAISPETGKLTSPPCRSKKLGHICEIQDCGEEHKMLPGVVRHGTSCYVYSCDVMTWYQARASCDRKGWRLAVLDRSSLEESGAPSRCDAYWIGLRRRDWLSPDGATHQNGNYPWADQEPSGTERCAVWSHTESGWSLRAESCEGKRAYFCVPAHGSTGTASRRGSPGGAPRTTAPFTDDRGVRRISAISAAVLLPPLWILLFFIVFFECWSKTKSPKSPKLTTEEDDAPVINKEH